MKDLFRRFMVWAHGDYATCAMCWRAATHQRNGAFLCVRHDEEVKAVCSLNDVMRGKA